MKRIILSALVLVILSSFVMADVPRESALDGSALITAVVQFGNDFPIPYKLKVITGLEGAYYKLPFVEAYRSDKGEELKARGNWIIDEDFQINLDDNQKRTINITLVNKNYTINFEEGIGSGGTYITVTREGQACGGTNGRIHENLPNSGKWIDDFKQECGISFFADWESLTLGTDVEVYYIIFTDKVLTERMTEVMDYIKEKVPVTTTADGTTTHFQAMAEGWRDKYRVININDPFDFIPNQDGSYKSCALIPIYFNEEISQDKSGKSKSLIITEGDEIRYFITMIPQYSNEYLVAKALKNQKIQDYLNTPYLTMESEVITDGSRWQRTTGNKIENLADFIDSKTMQYTALGTGTIAGATGTIYAVGTVAMNSWAAAYGTSTVLAGIAGAAGSTGVVSGGALTATGGAMTVLAITPIGWAIIAVAAVVITGVAVFHFTDSDTYIYDGGNLVINDDPQFWGNNEAKVNFLLIKAKAGDPFQPAVVNYTGGFAINFPSLPDGYTKENIGVQVLQGTDSVTHKTKWFGNKLVVYGLAEGNDYNVKLTLGTATLDKILTSKKYDASVFI